MGNIPQAMFNVCKDFWNSSKTGGYFGQGDESPLYYLALRKNSNQLEITNIRIERPNRGKGYFSEFLIKLHSWADKNKIQIKFSSVQNPDLRAKLERSGYNKSDLNYTREPK